MPSHMLLIFYMVFNGKNIPTYLVDLFLPTAVPLCSSCCATAPHQMIQAVKSVMVEFAVSLSLPFLFSAISLNQAFCPRVGCGWYNGTNVKEIHKGWSLRVFFGVSFLWTLRNRIQFEIVVTLRNDWLFNQYFLGTCYSIGAKDTGGRKQPVLEELKVKETADRVTGAKTTVLRTVCQVPDSLWVC